MALSVSVAQAEPSSLVAFDLETLRLLKNADPARGQELYEKERCAKCHGDAGVSDDSEDVNIAGLMPSYSYKQLKDYQDKNRDARSMYKAVRDLDTQQMADLAVWLGTQAPADPGPKKEMSDELFQLVYKGDPERLLKACTACHGRNGDGGMHDHPRINGQYREYFVTTMTEFKEGDRENDVYSRMRLVAEVLTEEEIEMLADYYAIPEPPE
jgi:cytochrome c553